MKLAKRILATLMCVSIVICSPVTEVFAADLIENGGDILESAPAAVSDTTQTEDLLETGQEESRSEVESATEQTEAENKSVESVLEPEQTEPFFDAEEESASKGEDTSESDPTVISDIDDVVEPEMGSGSKTKIEKRIDDLARLNGKYFNKMLNSPCTDHGGYGKVPRNYTADNPGGGDGCKLCSFSTVKKTDWFKGMFPDINCPVGDCQSCFGFALFARWYIFHTDNSSKVNFTKVTNGTVAFNKANLDKYAKKGDYIRQGGHYYIFLEALNDKALILDCNGDHHSKVQYNRERKYKDFTTYIEIWRADNYDQMNVPDCTNHGDYEAKGYCPNCGAYKTWDHPESGPKYPAYYKVKSWLPAVKKLPYNGSPTVCVITKGTKVRVDEVVRNAPKREWWCKVQWNGGTHYIWYDDLQYVEDAPQPAAKINISVWLEKSTITEGKPDTVLGTISAENCTIDRIESSFVSEGGAESYKYTTYANGKTSYSIKGSAVDSKLYCNKLTPGRYRVKLNVYANTGAGFTGYSDYFTVNPKKASAPVVNAPSISGSPISTFYGGSRWRITQNASGAQLYYSTNGGINYSVTNSSYVDVDIRSSTTIYAYSQNGSTRSSTASRNVSVTKLGAPYISFSQNAEGSVVSIGGSGEIYYRINQGSYMRYYGAFTVNANCTVSAYAQNPGYITSDTSNRSITVSAPDTPKIYLNTQADTAKDDAVSLYWNRDAKAKDYTVRIYCNDALYKEDTTTNTQYTFIADEVGQYRIEASATNRIGTSGTSNYLYVTAHAPSIVKFIDWDGTLISEQEVRYGRSAVKPATPKRRGYTFSGWNGGYTRVIKDETITAEYEINVYTVKFYDIDGVTLIGTQAIRYNESIDSAPVEEKVTLVNGGRVFAGWNVFYAKEDDSTLDLEHVDSDMKVRASTVWSNENLPVLIEDLNAVISYGGTSNVFNGYHVTCTFSTTDTKDQKAKVIVTLLTNTGDGGYKMINAKTDTIHFDASTNRIDWVSDITCDGSRKADRVEVSVFAIEGMDRTGGLIAETKHYDISTEASIFWSDWMTQEELEAKGHRVDEGDEVQSKDQYRSRNNKKVTTTTSSATPPSGYTYLSNDSYWGSWSNWTTTAIGSSSTRQVQTTSERVSSGYNQYRYGKWVGAGTSHFCPNEGKRRYGGTWTLKYTDWSTSRYDPIKGPQWGYCSNFSHNHVGANRIGSTDYWTEYQINGTYYYWEETNWVDTSYNRTLYSYRDYYYKYTHYKWVEGAWSDWTDDIITDNDANDRAMEVETRKLYRYVVYNAAGLNTDTEGTRQQVTGTLSGNNIGSKNAAVLVYKSKNTDPTESQLEYVGATRLTDNGGYSFSFVTKEEPTYNTGDYVIALGVEGSDNLINVGMIRYDRSSHNVSFEVDGEIIDSQSVVDGQSAVIPQMPEKEGYVFTGWSRNTTCVDDDTVTVATFAPEQYCVAFTDYVNHTCTLVRVDAGSNIQIPDSIMEPSCEGYIFKGWNIPEGPVNEDIVVEATWEAKKFKVNFFDDDDKIIDTQEVEFGGSAVLPETIQTEEGRKFLAWSNDESWWDVQSDINVFPIVVYDKVLSAPTTNISDVEEGRADSIVLEAEEGAIIYYTTDGSYPSPDNVEPDENEAEHMAGVESAENGSGEDEEGNYGVTYIYSGPISVDGNMSLNVMAVKDGCESSDIAEFFYNEDGRDITENYEEDVTELSSRYVNLTDGSIMNVDVSIAEGTRLNNAVFTIKIDPTVMAMGLDENYNYEIEAGELIDGNGFLYADTDHITEGFIRVYWNGEAPIEGGGRLFRVKLYCSGCSDAVNYPIIVGYVPKETTDDEFAPVELKDIVDVSFYKNGKEVEETKQSTTEEQEDKGLTVSDIPEQIYTGKAICPKVKIRDNDRLLVEGVDYKLSYKNNTAVGSMNDDDAPMVVIQGQGNYSDTLVVYFDIVAANISSAAFVCDSIIAVKENGREQTPVPMIRYNGKKLAKGKDFEIDYIDSNNLSVTPSAEGSYIIRLTGKGNFTGERRIDFRISANDPISKAKIGKIPDQKYTGKLIEPEAEVKLGGKTLTKDVDYTLSYEDNINAGKAKLIVTGIDNYAGVVTKQFNIVGTPIKGAVVSQIKNYRFTGSNIMPKPEVTLGEKKLTENVDYTLKYDKNRNVGTGSVIIEGTGGYTGKIKKSFKITGIDMKDNTDLVVTLYDSQGRTLSQNAAFEYTKGGVAPDISVTDKSNNYELVAGKDYSVSYSNNKGVTKDDKPSYVIVKGKKNYKGKLTVSFRIVTKDIAKTAVSIQDKGYSKKKGAYKSVPVITDTNGKKLAAGIDYERKITYVYAADTTVNGDIARKAGDKVEDDDIPGIGTVIAAIIEGKGNYANSTVRKEYTIVKYSISKARVAVKDMYYTGREIHPDPSKDEVRVVVNGKKLTYGVDYVIDSYSNNVRKGTAKLTVRGIGEYGGEKEASFRIGTRKILWWIL